MEGNSCIQKRLKDFFFLLLYKISPGYVYLTFDSDKSVKSLLMACAHDPTNGGQYFYKVSSRRIRNKEVSFVLCRTIVLIAGTVIVRNTNVYIVVLVEVT